MRRWHVILLIAVGVVVFLVISALLARAFSIDGAERQAITALVQAEARGNTGAMTSDIQGCGASPSCRARVAQNASVLRRRGAVVILELNESAGFSFGSTVGTARVVWRAGSALPVVQCVRVRRAGNLFSGYAVQLLVLSVRIKTDADCPARY
jgi:hypothetical protein